jgi:predicted DNA-binding protein with PD1-like motif
METHILSATVPNRMFAVVFHAGDDVCDGLLAFARQGAVTAASFTAIGALQRVVVGFFDPDSRKYNHITIDEQVEVLTMSGNIAIGPDGPVVHAHLVVGRSDGTAHGGHLIRAIVRPTLEVIVTETPARLRRRLDPATGLTLIDTAISTMMDRS